MEDDYGLNLENEKKLLDSERNASMKALENTRNQYAEMLLGSMGKDIEDVLSGKVKVKLTWKEKMKYKIRGFIDTILKIF